MTIIKRRWTPEAADEWSKEDWIAVLLSALSYVFLAVGSALSFLLLAGGFIILAVGIGLALLMYWIIDPKLRAVSNRFEEHQKHYLEEMETIQRWEQSDE